MCMRHLMPWAPCSQSGDEWKNWKPTSWTHSASVQFWFSSLLSFLLAASAADSCLCRAQHGAPTLWVAMCHVGHRGQTSAGWVEHLQGIYFALLCSPGWRYQQQLYSIHASGLETWKLLVPGHDPPRLGSLSLQDSNTCSTDLEAGKKAPPSRSTEQRAKQGSLNGGLQKTCGIALGAGFHPLSRFEGDMNPALRICCPYLPLPLEVTSPNPYSKPRQGEVPGHSEWKGCLTPFPMECKLLLEIIWIPFCYKNPLPTGLSAFTIGRRVIAPKLLFHIVKSSTHWSNKQEKKNGPSCAWCSGTSPRLKAASWGQPACHCLESFSEEAAPLAVGNASLPGDTFPLEAKAACLADTSHCLPTPSVYAAVGVLGKPQGDPHTLSPAIILQGERLSAAAPRV